VLNRWQIELFDYFSYIPDSMFGFAGGTNLSLPGIGGSLGPTIPGLGGSTTPGQSIYSAYGPRYSNTFVPQLTYLLSRKVSFTAAGSYSLLRFTQTGNVDEDMFLGSTGLNYTLNRSDSIGVMYRFASYHYAGQPQALGNHIANVVYVRKISQRMALSLSGGPQITTFRVPIGTSTHTIGASGGASLNYTLKHGSVGLSYYHGLGGGSGVLIGSNSDTVTGSLNRQLSRVWNGYINGGYSRNANLVNEPGTPETAYNDWYVGGGIIRPFGRNINLSLAYTARIQHSTNSACTGPNCNTNFTQHMVSVSLQWHTRPLTLQ
jgi:hypothetical protein